MDLCIIVLGVADEGFLRVVDDESIVITDLTVHLYHAISFTDSENVDLEGAGLGGRIRTGSGRSSILNTVSMGILRCSLYFQPTMLA